MGLALATCNTHTSPHDDIHSSDAVTQWDWSEVFIPELDEAMLETSLSGDHVHNTTPLVFTSITVNTSFTSSDSCNGLFTVLHMTIISTCHRL